MAFALLQTVVTAWYAGVEASAANRLITRHAVSFVFPLPLAYRDRIAQVPGVNKVTYAIWFSGVYIDKNQFFARLAVDSDTFFDVYPEFVIAARAVRSVQARAQRLHYRHRHRQPVQSQDRRHHARGRRRLSGSMGVRRARHLSAARPDDRSFVDDVSLQYVDERVRQEAPHRAGQIGWYIVRIDDPDSSARISQDIDNLFANSRAETKTETERAFQQGFLSSASAVITAMNIMSFVIIGIILLVVGNTMVMSARERSHEFAVLKALGFSGRQLFLLLTGESMILSIAGSALGLLVTIPAVEGFQSALPKGWFPVFYIKPETIVIGAIAGLAVGFIASLIPLRRVLTTRIVEGLRYVG